MGKGKEVTAPIRGAGPCMGCVERFLACADRCPKDERGEYGYKAWKTEVDRVNKNRREYAKHCGIAFDRHKKRKGGF